uniref:Tripartite motif containing 35-12 n=1 Tax=Salarias fasciatus TaxID=181472 RepID=A0A672GBF2_SALFA
IELAMASCSEEDLCCPACQDFFRDPLLLSCSHSFCRSCLHSWWSMKQVQECPLCRVVCAWSNPPSNLALRNLCETLRGPRSASRSASLCRLHHERLKLFCLDHQQPACVVCRDAKVHADHRFRPIDEEAQERREELRAGLKPLQDRLKAFTEAERNFRLAAEHLKKQSRRVERRVREQFRKLREFLQEEEEARLQALREEEEQKTGLLRAMTEELSRDMEALSHAVTATEEELRADDASFLTGYQVSGRRVQQCLQPDPPQLPEGTLIDVAKHLGNLTFNIWNKMKDMVTYTPVVLDPNTANAELVLSEDLSSARHGKRQRLPDNPERFGFWDSVLGSEGLCRGAHSWDVEVGDSREWELGVLPESVCRTDFSGSAAWSLELSAKGYRAYSPKHKYTALPLTHKLRRVRVHLDWERGELTFSDPDSNTHIHTFTHTFTETLSPHLNLTKLIKKKSQNKTKSKYHE